MAQDVGITHTQNTHKEAVMALVFIICFIVGMIVVAVMWGG